MSLADWWRSWLGEDAPKPPAILTVAEVVERVRAYAMTNNLRFGEPIDIKLKRQLRDHKEPQAGHRYVYTMALCTNIPVPFVDVDASDGTILAWRTLPR